MPYCFNAWRVQAVQSTHRAEEIVISTYKSFKEEEMKRKNTQKILEVKDKKLLEVTTSLNKAENEKLSSEATLKTAEKQVETQRL